MSDKKSKKKVKRTINLLQEKKDQILLSLMKTLLTYPEFVRWVNDNFEIKYVIDDKKKLVTPCVIKRHAIETQENKIVLAR